jgi:hypothetical protein
MLFHDGKNGSKWAKSINDGFSLGTNDPVFSLGKFETHLLSLDNRIKLLAGFIVTSKINAYYPDKNNIYITVDGVPSAAHEISHMVEIKKIDRCILSDWGFNMNPVKEYDPNFNYKSINELLRALALEARVRGIQKRILLSKLSLSTLDNLPHFFAGYPYIKSNEYLCNIIRDEIKYTKFVDTKDSFSIKRAIEWTDAISDRYFDLYSLDRIEYEWKEKLNFIFNWMETK